MARTAGRRQTNEMEFQGQVMTWLNAEIARWPGSGLDRATQEKPRDTSGKRNDLVVWHDRQSAMAFLAIELKTPTTPINDPVLIADAIEKAQNWNAPYFAIWNMREYELYPTPPVGETPLPSDCISKSSAGTDIRTVEDWLIPTQRTVLQCMALGILESALDHRLNGHGAGTSIDPEIFVSRLTAAIRRLRMIIYRDLNSASATKKRLKIELTKLAAEQGFLGFVEDVPYAIAGQIGYRYVGQILFYHALRRKLTTLPPIQLDATDRLPQALTIYWNEVRRYDYEALFGPHAVEALVPLSEESQLVLRQLIAQLATYDWASLTDDVLGSIFERLIPREEQMLLGQFYTPRRVADLMVAFTLDGERPLVLDPGCGSGTFLMSAYSYLRHSRPVSHKELLSTLWGFDISPFAAELAVINLYRQDMASYENFPRIVTDSFLDLSPGKTVKFPAPKQRRGQTEKIDIPIPMFDAILANPPYVRSQHQDDLDPNYRSKLFSAAAKADVSASAKTDLFAFFLYHSVPFLKEGARVGFVTSASWLTADFASTLQKLLLDKFKIVAIITSEAESFFTQVSINTVILIAEYQPSAAGTQTGDIKFVTLKRTLSNLAPDGQSYWDDMTDLAAEIESIEIDTENDKFRIKLLDHVQERSGLISAPNKPLNWSKPFRAPLSYYAIFGNL